MSLIFVARLWRGWFSSLQRSDRCTKRTRKIASSAHGRLVGCSVDRMAAHTKAAPDDNVLRLIDRALGKLNDSAGCSPRPGLVARSAAAASVSGRWRRLDGLKEGDFIPLGKGRGRSQLGFESEPAPIFGGAGSVA